MRNGTELKKFLMTHMWRFQQSQAFYSLIFWSLALAGIFYDRSGWYFERYFGLSADPNEQVATKMAVLMALVLLMVIVFGFFYDIIFRLWEQQSMITVERNVYSQYKVQVRYLLINRNFYIPLLKSLNKEGEFDKEVEFLERWTDKLIRGDAVTQLYHKHVTDWVFSDTIPWKPPSTEKLMAAYRKKEIEDSDSPSEQ